MHQDVPGRIARHRSKMAIVKKYARTTGMWCFGLAALVLAPSALLHCIWPALRIGTPSLVSGALLGLAMAGVTRTTKPTAIYLLVIAGALTAVPMYNGWPAIQPTDMPDSVGYDGPVGRVFTYLDTLRPVMYLLGVLFPYACFGQHAPDPILTASDQTTQTIPEPCPDQQ